MLSSIIELLKSYRKFVNDKQVEEDGKINNKPSDTDKSIGTLGFLQSNQD
jgi:hypothetical protein